jgi:hypothetical protein
MDLKDFENKISSEEFSKRALNAFESLRNSPGGISKMRMRRRGEFARKLVEEILPISVFLRCFERPGLNLYCQYFSGYQSFDGKIYCQGLLVERKFLKDEYLVEVSIACHEKDYLKRKCLEGGFPCFSASGMKELKNGTVISEPVVNTPADFISEHINFIKSRIEKKGEKNYPNNTFLIIPIFPDTVLMRDDWIEIRNKLESTEEIAKFCSVFVYDKMSYRMAFL